MISFVPSSVTSFLHFFVSYSFFYLLTFILLYSFPLFLSRPDRCVTEVQQTDRQTVLRVSCVVMPFLRRQPRVCCCSLYRAFVLFICPFIHSSLVYLTTLMVAHVVQGWDDTNK
jgi:hypothetical protein